MSEFFPTIMALPLSVRDRIVAAVPLEVFRVAANKAMDESHAIGTAYTMAWKAVHDAGWAYSLTQHGYVMGGGGQGSLL